MSWDWEALKKQQQAKRGIVDPPYGMFKDGRITNIPMNPK